jgi:hypothetical protein
VPRQIDLNSLIGVWQRRSIRWPDGREDTSTRVWWLQANPHFADIRIPANRPDFLGINSWAECDPPRQAWLRRQEGFAGILTQQNDAWQWHREMDFQPTTGKRDIGRLRLSDSTGNLMIEEGIDEPYLEIWQRIDDGDAFTLRHYTNRGLLIVVGQHFLMCLQHDDALLELSHGMREGPMSSWTISDSTLPWREGDALFSELNSGIENWTIISSPNIKPNWMI